MLKPGIKTDPLRLWGLPDRIFFGHGACQFLATDGGRARHLIFNLCGILGGLRPSMRFTVLELGPVGLSSAERKASTASSRRAALRATGALKLSPAPGSSRSRCGEP